MSLFAEILKQPSKLDCLKNPQVLQLEELTFSPFHILALTFFLCAIIHTLSVHKIHNWARTLEKKEAAEFPQQRKQRSLLVQIVYFFAEVETVFVLWTIPLFIAMMSFFGTEVALEYINTRDYTEPLFIVVILAMTATRPIVHLSEKCMVLVAKRLGGSLSAWWFALLTIGPILGSFITEVGAMALIAILLSRQFYQAHPSHKLAYATLALLFVNVSVGGLLTNFASPAVLILAHAWNWTGTDVFVNFGWKAILGILISNTLYWLYFRKEFDRLQEKQKHLNHHSTHDSTDPIPHWITIAHILFIIWVVVTSAYPASFIASFIVFLGFYHATRTHQYTIHLIRPMLVGLFLAGLIIHGGLQGWWVLKVFDGLSPRGVLGTAMSLTAFNDNAAISYLATLIPNWGHEFQYAVFVGVVAGGGLTVIANAPNPAGYVILRKHFDKGINPWKLLAAALPSTLILYAIYYCFGPLI